MEYSAPAMSVLTAALLLVIALGQFRGNPAQLEALDAVGIPRERVPLIAGTQLCGAVGLLAGLAWSPVGVAAAVGVALLFVVALGVHVRAHNRNVAPALVMLTLAVTTLALLLGD